MKDVPGVIGLYADGSIGMDHPLFMARVEARQFGRRAALSGTPLAQTLTGARDRIAELFGEVPQPLVDASVTTAWLEAVEQVGGGDA